MIKLGWKAGPEQYPPQQLLDYAVAAEQAGFDSIDVSDHFHPWSEEGQACFVWTWLGAAAVRTRKIILGTGVTCPILRYHPAIIAQAAATLAAFAPGRSFLGLGTGEALKSVGLKSRLSGVALETFSMKSIQLPDCGQVTKLVRRSCAKRFN